MSALSAAELLVNGFPFIASCLVAQTGLTVHEWKDSAETVMYLSLEPIIHVMRPRQNRPSGGGGIASYKGYIRQVLLGHPGCVCKVKWDLHLMAVVRHQIARLRHGQSCYTLHVFPDCHNVCERRVMVCGQ